MCCLFLLFCFMPHLIRMFFFFNLSAMSDLSFCLPNLILLFLLSLGFHFHPMTCISSSYRMRHITRECFPPPFCLVQAPIWSSPPTKFHCSLSTNTFFHHDLLNYGPLKLHQSRFISTPLLSPYIKAHNKQDSNH